MTYNPKRILQGAPNARDLGGIKTQDGRKIRQNRLIRSGHLANATPEDVKYLEETGLRAIVDFRTDYEASGQPDTAVSGAENIRCPIFRGEAMGVTREMPTDPDSIAQLYVEKSVDIIAAGGGKKLMEGTYAKLVTEDFPIEHYKLFFEILMSVEDGGVLYHCTMGKDRVGTGTALLLTALGVSRENIVQDYLYTKTRLDGLSQEMIARCAKYTDDKEKLETIYAMDTVNQSYIETVFAAMERESGSAENYLREKMAMTPEKITLLRDMYLE